MSAYTIQPGDTLTAIARRFGTTVEALARVNGIADPDRIYAGRTLQLPDPRVKPQPKPPAAKPATPPGAGLPVRAELPVLDAGRSPPAPRAPLLPDFLGKLQAGDFALLAGVAVMLAVFVMYQPEPRKRGKA